MKSENINNFLFANLLQFDKNIAKTNILSALIFSKKKLATYYNWAKGEMILDLKLKIKIYFFIKKKLTPINSHIGT